MIRDRLSAIGKRIETTGLPPVVRDVLLVSVLFVLQLMFAGTVFGAEEAAHGAEWKEWLYKIFNFAILVFILVYFLNKPLKSFLRQRTEIIEKSLREAQEARRLAEKALAEVEERLKLKDKEIEEILARAEQSARAEQDLLVRSGEEMSEKILEKAKTNIDYELRLARESIKAEAAEIALQLAEKKLKEKLTREEQIRLIEESLARLEGKK